MSLIAKLDQAIKAAGVPIAGVSIGDVANRATWRVTPPSLQAQAQPIIDAFIEPTLDELKEERATRDIDATALRAIVMEIYPFLNNGKPTLAQLRRNIIDRYKSLNGI